MAPTWSPPFPQRRSSHSPRQRLSSGGSSWRSTCRRVSWVCPALRLTFLRVLPGSSSPHHSTCCGTSGSSSLVPWVSAREQQCHQGCFSVPAPAVRRQWWGPAGASASGSVAAQRASCMQHVLGLGANRGAVGWTGIAIGPCRSPRNARLLTHLPPSAAGRDAGRQRDLQQLLAQGPAGVGQQPGRGGCGGAERCGVSARAVGGLSGVGSVPGV